MARHPARLVLAGCLALAAALLLLDLRGAGIVDGMRGATAAVAGPPQQAIAWVRTEVGERFGGSADELARIAELEQELAEARAAAAAAAAGSVTAEDARELAAGLPTEGYRFVEARVVALATPRDQVRSATISAGSTQGVRAGLAVVGPGGLAGLVESVGPGVATVRLIVDPGAGVAARVATSREAGLLTGTGEAASLTPLDPLADLAAGDLVVTMGTPDGSIPADLPVGRIEATSGSAADLSRLAAVAPAVDPSTLDRVLVLVPDPTGATG